MVKPDVYIFFNKSHYYPGETVKGYVLVEFEKDTRAKSLKIGWGGLLSRRCGRGEVKTSINELPLKETAVWEAENNWNKIPAGEYEYPFRFKLASTAPPTFWTRPCDIQYQVIVKLEKPLWIFNTTHKKEFKVLKGLRLSVETDESETESERCPNAPPRYDEIDGCSVREPLPPNYEP
ncbi:hypothetical protein GCK72_004808 [Caenorhabditis remanei]|uniref:Arrestin-like N-terminal domain-containing protein n=1 Tax=Caenorhabditis remanei TaxID=31234 RepID=A0A6A5HAR2_CAERE|nr:hypothetical protein GCK72_004808 [Caenorhabditis remanei]KAF1764858.1 hypothetical protein GCK72_004808 [Caenorhabditis remanei]